MYLSKKKINKQQEISRLEGVQILQQLIESYIFLYFLISI